MTYATVVVILDDNEQHSIFVSDTKIEETMEMCRRAVVAGVQGFVVVHVQGTVTFHNSDGTELERILHPAVSQKIPQKIPVMFRLDTRNNDIVAVFMDAETHNPEIRYKCYLLSTGQDECSRFYIDNYTRFATVEEYQKLLAALERVYGTDTVVIQNHFTKKPV